MCVFVLLGGVREVWPGLLCGQTDSRHIYHVVWQEAPPPDQTIVPS